MFHIKQLELVHWDYWRRFTLPLDAQIITIVGPNGSGKTTLLRSAARRWRTWTPQTAASPWSSSPTRSIPT